MPLPVTTAPPFTPALQPEKRQPSPVGLALSAGTETVVPSPFGTSFSPALEPSRTFCAERRPTDKIIKRKARAYFLRELDISKLPHSSFFGFCSVRYTE